MATTHIARKRAGIIATLLAAILAVPSTAGPTQHEPAKGAQQRLASFLTAFENLDMDPFIACFADDATVFFPTPEPPQRFDGKRAIRDHFQQVFDAIRRASGASSPPFHNLRPEDLSWQVLAPDAVIATFHLRNSERIARRTVVLTKAHGTWLIAHLHASNVPVAEPPAPAHSLNHVPRR